MIQTYPTSDGSPYELATSYLDNLAAPTVRQPSLPHNGTIDPSWLVRGPLSQHGAPSVPFVSTEIWMGYPGSDTSYEAPTLVGILTH